MKVAWSPLAIERAYEAAAYIAGDSLKRRSAGSMVCFESRTVSRRFPSQAVWCPR